ncbi:MAG TPA: hypothetical protein PLR08_01760 [bacterium]|nr:hypothetical protein [Candidatus Magasanikbacteria bacterium]HPF95257.1 hypothetical protein [bacterium]
MSYFNTWGEALTASGQNLLSQFISYTPKIIGALVVLLVGLFIASIIARAVRSLLKYTKIDVVLEKLHVKRELETYGLGFSFAGLVSWVVKWFLNIAVFIAVVDVLELTQVTNFLQQIALYLPNVIVAIIILAVGLIVGKFVQDIVKKGVEASKTVAGFSGFLSGLAKWSIVVFTFMAALVQLGIATSLIQIVLTGIVVMFSLAGGIAFGLGGKNKAEKLLESIDQNL